MTDEDENAGRPSTNVDHSPAPPLLDAVDPASAAAKAGAAEESRAHDALIDLATRIDLGIGRILQAFDEKLKYDASKQQTVDRLYSELQGHRGGLVAQATRPFIFGMIRHHAEIGKLLGAIRDAPTDDLTAAKFCQLLESLQEDVEEVLGENGIAAYRAELSDPFDPLRQTVVGKPTGDDRGEPLRHRRRVSRPGLRARGQDPRPRHGCPPTASSPRRRMPEPWHRSRFLSSHRPRGHER